MSIDNHNSDHKPQSYVGIVRFRLESLPEYTRNAFNDCHGGALATYIDIATTTGLYAFDNKGRTHVSAKLDIEYITAGKTASAT